jgi:hypothetical protein
MNFEKKRYNLVAWDLVRRDQKIKEGLELSILVYRMMPSC